MVGPSTELAPAMTGDGSRLPSPRVAFLGGLGRSGTTLLERILDQAHDVQALGEVTHLWQRSLKDNELCGCGRPFDQCPFWSEVGKVGFGGWQNVDADRLLFLRDRVDRSRRLPRLLTTSKDSTWRAELREYVSYYERLYAAASRVSGCNVVVDSSKQASLPYCLSTSQAIQLRVIHCVRDSRAVAYSWGQDVKRPESTTESGARMHRFSPRDAAFYWMLHNAEVDMLGVRAGRLLRVRYEDWVRCPNDTLREIRTFVGLCEAPGGSDPGRSFTLKPSHTCSGNPMRFAQGKVDLRLDERWRSRMSARDSRVVTAMTLPLLLRYGYVGLPGT